VLTHFRSLVTTSAGARLTAGATRAVWFVAQSHELPLLELANLDAAPAISGANDSRVHQLQHRPLAERMGMIFVRRRYSRRFVVRITRR